MPNEKEVSSTLMDLWPFMLLGGAGGFIKAINDKNFNIKDLLIRVVTGAFCASLGGLYLSSTSYSIEVQYAFSGAVGVAGSDLIKALMRRMTKEITGEETGDDEQATNYLGSDSGSNTGGGIPVDATEYAESDSGDTEN